MDRWNSSGTSERKSSIKWTVEKAEKATALPTEGQCHFDGVMVFGPLLGSGASLDRASAHRAPSTFSPAAWASPASHAQYRAGAETGWVCRPERGVRRHAAPGTIVH